MSSDINYSLNMHLCSTNFCADMHLCSTICCVDMHLCSTIFCADMHLCSTIFYFQLHHMISFVMGLIFITLKIRLFSPEFNPIRQYSVIGHISESYF